METLLSVLSNNLDIHPKYCSLSPIKNIVICCVNGKWLRHVIHEAVYQPPPMHIVLTPDEVQSALQLDENIGQYWEKILIQVIPKTEEKFFPWPSFTAPCVHSNQLNFSHLLHYVSLSNTENLWKDSYRKFSDHSVSLQKEEEPNLSLELELQPGIVRKALSRLYNCPFLYINKKDQVSESAEQMHPSHEVHPNIHPASCIVESGTHFFVFLQPSNYSVHHCVHFSPSKLNDNEANALFLVYQLLEATRDTQDRSLFVGDLSLHHLRIDAALHLTVIPDVTQTLLSPKPAGLSLEDIQKISNSTISVKKEAFIDQNGKINQNVHSKGKRISGYLSLLSKESAYILEQNLLDTNTDATAELEDTYQSTLLHLTQLWVCRQISNLDYLLCLSYFCGHSFDSPIHHPTLPWVTDFTSPRGSWRDLTKSKYRIHKGDQQLDQTYEINDSLHQDQIAHHIPEFFSEVTYYVYKARLTPKALLQKHVRNHFVPSHYPSSVGRMYAWSPEECIPDFYLNPSVFKSIHKDLPDLQIPSWCSSVEDFLIYHRSRLESDYVSKRLHQWIDLYYGYKLSGGASVKAKNVCLSLVDAHKELQKGGVVQLFTVPHPPRSSPSSFLSNYPPPLCHSRESSKELKNLTKIAEDASAENSGSSPNPKSKTKSVSDDKLPIELPSNYNPLSALNQVEMLFNFCLKTSGKVPQKVPKVHSDSLSAKQATHLRRVRDMQVLGCLIIELFAAPRCRMVNHRAKLEDRYLNALKILKYDSTLIPKCLHQTLKVIFQLERADINDWPSSLPLKYKAITDSGLPPPSFHQLLHPLIDMIIFPTHFTSIYSFIKKMNNYSMMMEESQYIPDIPKREEFMQKISELQVRTASNELSTLLPLPAECLQLILPYMVDLFEGLMSSINAAWYLFGPLSQALGPIDTRQHLLPHLIKLYEREVISDKQIKLFHRSFLLQLLIRLGLKCFLKHFISAIIEGAGGHKECISGGIAVYINSNRRQSNLKKVAACPTLSEAPLVSPSDDDSCSHSHSFSQSTSGSHEIFKRRSSSAKLSTNTDADITDAENDTEIFVFDGADDDEDDTIEDLQDDSVPNLNSQARSPECSDVVSLDDVYYQDTNSPSPSPHSPQAYTEEIDDSSIKEETTDPSEALSPTQKNSSSNITIPRGKQSLIAGSVYSTSLPDKPQNLSTFMETVPEPPKNNNQSPQIEKELPKIQTDSSSNGSIVEVCCESVLWLSHRLGPVLTARHITRNLLRMLTLCYLPDSNALTPLPVDPKDKLSVTRKRILGDKSSSKVIYCLSEIASLYGEQMILLQYLSHVTELISWCEGRLSFNQEGGLIGTLVLLQHIILQLSDTTFMEHLQETLIQNAVYPVIRLISSTKVSFPSGAAVRGTLAWRVVDSLYLMALRMGREMSKKKLTSAITRFLTSFDKVHMISSISRQISSGSPRGQASPPSHCSPKGKFEPSHLKEKVLEELKQVFTPELAYLSYVPMCRFLGTEFMKQSLPNHDLLHSLCLQFDENNQSHHAAVLTYHGLASSEMEDDNSKSEKGSGLMANVAVTGNRIDIKVPNDGFTSPTGEEIPPSIGFASVVDITKYTNNNMENTQRHLRGNWFAYWEHEIGRSEQESSFNFKQIKLQTFVGHTAGIKSFYVLDNENSFMSSSRDKTIKLWSLRSQGDGTAQMNSHWTYTNHKKPVFDVVFSTTQRVAASCDSTVHIWDPFIGTCLNQLDSIKYPPVSVLKAMPAPSSQLVTATTDSTLRFIDLRTYNYTNELKISTSAVGLVRCVAVSDDSRLVAVAHSSGVISTLDLRTGQLLSSWKLHEGEVKELCWLEKGIFISSALDQTVMVWNAYDNKTRFPLRGPAEPVHLLRPFNRELILGTTSNRIGVLTSVSPSSSFSCTKLRSDVLKGALTTMSILPLNRQLLLGSDNGTITLIC